jgi:organic hydroperoxide reductase OsmC/OhrA
MSVHTATIEWKRGDQVFTDRRYSRAHDWRFDGGAVVRASSDPSSILPPLSDPAAVDPEEALVAAVSACHMMFFLAYAAKAGFTVDSYVDQAEGTLGRDERGKTAITAVTLRPRVAWSGETTPTPDDVVDLHHRSHEDCFIANSIRAPVRVESV